MDTLDGDRTPYDLQHLYLSDNQFDVEGAIKLAKLIEKGRLDNLRVLDITKNCVCGLTTDGKGKMDTSGLTQICDAIFGNPQQSNHPLPLLQSFFVQGNHIKGGARDILSKALDFRGQRVDVDELTSLGSDICTISPDKVSLNLAHTKLGPDEARFMGSCLRCVKTDHLVELDLSNNNLCGYDEKARESFQMDSFIYLCNTLKRIDLASLTSLNLSHNCISAKGTVALVDLFHSGAMMRLEVLKLDHVGMIPMIQKFGAVKKTPNFEGILALSESIDREDLPVLHTLSIVGNDVHNAQALLQQAIGSTQRLNIAFKY